MYNHFFLVSILANLAFMFLLYKQIRKNLKQEDIIQDLKEDLDKQRFKLLTGMIPKIKVIRRLEVLLDELENNNF